MRKDKMTKIMTKLFGREAPLDTRLFNVILVGTMVASALGVSATLAKGASVWVAAVVALMVLLFAFFIWFGNTFNKIKECGLVVGIVYNVILLPIIYFFAGGTESGMNSWFSMGIISCFLLYTGRRFYLMLGLSSVSFLSCYFVNYFHPEFVVQLKSKSAVNFDCCFAMMAVSTVLGILIKFQKKIYEQERQVSEMQKIKIEEANRTKSRFLASMSHEIRTPINTIIGLNEMNLREAVSPEVEENSINIQRASRMLLSLINDVLDLSKIESGKMEIIPRKYEFSVLLSDMINITWIRAQEKKLEFKMDIDPEVPGVLYGDDVRISQVVTNLLTNAIKYTQQGSVTLGVRVLSIVDDYVKLRISVSDTGMGIKTEDIPFLFNSFQRLDESQNRAIEGTGLGLAISKQLVDMMDGEMAVESIYQKGSTFSITLKQKIIDRRPMEYALKILNSGGKHSYKQTFEAPEARVLIVDDNEMNRMVAKKLLRATKVRVDLAASGAECLEMVRKYFYHVIFMDHMMPGMDGIETLKSIRKQENGMNKGVPVIALTANVVSGAEKMYRSKGFQGYLMKPINGNLFEAMLLRFLPDEVVVVREEEVANVENDIALFHGNEKKKICLTTESVSDLSEEMLRRYDVKMISYYVRTEEGRFCDVTEMSSENISEYLRQPGRYVASDAPSVEEYEAFFEKNLEDAEQVIHICMAEKSGRGYYRAKKAAERFTNVHVLDCGTTSCGMGLLTLDMIRMLGKTEDVEELKAYLERKKQVIRTSCVLATPERLYSGGQCSKPLKILCEAFQLRPSFTLVGSKIVSAGVYSGSEKQAYKKFIRKNLRRRRGIDKKILYITYAGCSYKLRQELMREVKRYQNFETIIEQQTSAVITSNCGLGTYAMAFMYRDED